MASKYQNTPENREPAPLPVSLSKAKERKVWAVSAFPKLLHLIQSYL